MRRITFAALLLLLAPAIAAAQQARPDSVPPVDTVVVVVRMRDRTEFTGKVTARDDSTLTLASPSGALTVIPIRLVLDWRRSSSDFTNGRLRTEDPDQSRLVLGPTGRTLPKGSVFFTDYLFFFPMLGFGVSDHLTISGGVSLLPGAESQVVYVAPKIGIVRTPTASIAIGGLYAQLPEGNGNAGDVYVSGTFGSVDHSLTLSVGYPFANGDRSSEPGFLVGGETRMGRDQKLILEIWRLPGVTETPIVVGLRGFGRKVSVDFGMLRILGAHMTGLPFIPWIAFSMKF